jgi:hypothetical protein
MRLRKGLVVVQFTISQLMIIFSVIMAQQASYLKKRDLGFDKKAVVSLVLPKSDSARLYTLKNELLRGRGVRSASLAFAAPSAEGYLGYKYQFMDAKSQPKEGYLQAKLADTAYLATFGIELLAGRNLHHADTPNEIVVNELMTKQMDFGQPEQALGASITIFDDNAGVQRPDKRIVGVVKDFVTNTLRNETTACTSRASLSCCWPSPLWWAAPIGYSVLEHLVLVNYANRITIGASIFLITFMAALGIALLTVGYRSLLAATQNPARSLRTE